MYIKKPEKKTKLIKCKACGNEIYELAEKCPKCGWENTTGKKLLHGLATAIAMGIMMYATYYISFKILLTKFIF